MTQFRFLPEEICSVASIMRWRGGLATLSRYQCDSVTASCIVLSKLATPCRWYDLETRFGTRASKISEIIRTVVEGFVQEKAHTLIEVGTDIIEERAVD